MCSPSRRMRRRKRKADRGDTSERDAFGVTKARGWYFFNVFRTNIRRTLDICIGLWYNKKPNGRYGCVLWKNSVKKALPAIGNRSKGDV